MPDIIILDLNMPLMDGYENSQWLSEHYSGVKILILSMYDSDIALIRLLQHGVRGFLKKNINPDELRFALETVVNHGYYYNNNTGGRIASLFNKTGHGNLMLEKSMLKENEISFLKFCSSDMTYKEIAIRMGISTRVVDNYRDALFEKLNVKSRVGLAIYAMKNGIVTI